MQGGYQYGKRDPREDWITLSRILDTARKEVLQLRRDRRMLPMIIIALIMPITYLIPLRYYLVIVRSVLLKGTGIGLLWDQVLPMALPGTVIFIGSVFAFRKKLE